MKLTRFLPLLLLPQLAQADLAQAERLVRNAHYAEALTAIPAEDTSPEALYWKGQALLHLERLPEAAIAFNSVPQDSPLYPFAAKGILFCAWKSPSLNFVEMVAPLTASSNKEIATLALAALAEHQLRHTRQGDTSPLETLRNLSQSTPDLAPLVKLLDLEALRRQGKYDQALLYGRDLENDPSYPALMKQRVRLALSDVYYDKEAALKGTELQDGDEDDEGRGEETLLQFISANPNSPLLEEAFRRLDERHAFTDSEYALAKLREWTQAAEHSRRATMALLALQRLRLLHEPSTQDATYANTAHAIFPQEPATRVILQERIRDLFAKEKKTEAKLYLDMLQGEDDARTRFFRAMFMADTNKHAAKDEFLRCADVAPSDVRPFALANAMTCAYETGDEYTVQQILDTPMLPSGRRLILLAHAELILATNPEQARKELEEAATLSPTPIQMADIDMALAQIELLSSPETSLQRLNNYPPDVRKNWSDTRILRLFALRMQAYDKIAQKQEGTQLDTPSPSLSLIREALATDLKPAIRVVLTSTLADRLAEAGHHEEALGLLESLIPSLPSGEHKARLYMMAAREAEQLGSLPALKKAISLYEASIRLDTPLANRARARMASILAWINQGDKAKEILHTILRSKEKLSADEMAHAYTVMADVWAMAPDEESHNTALQYCEKIWMLEGISAAWKTRARLQHAMFCSRFLMHTTALTDYLSILATCPATGADPHEEEWFVLYAAGAGAISEHLQLKNYEEAARLAEQIAAWPHPVGKQRPASEAAGPQAKRFADWAEAIRRTHYLKPGSRAQNGAQRTSHHTAR